MAIQPEELDAADVNRLSPKAGGADAPVDVTALGPLACLLALIAFLIDVLWRRRPGRLVTE